VLLVRGIPVGNGTELKAVKAHDEYRRGDGQRTSGLLEKMMKDAPVTA
jgi:hypothetical protein